MISYNGIMGSYIIDSFSVKNYRSFYDEQIVLFGDNQPVLAFYGANASGKTNLYQAMLMFCRFVRHSIDPASHGVLYEPFLLRKGSDRMPSVFTIVFHNDVNKFQYSFSTKDKSVVEEEMYDLSSSRPRTIFVRSNGPTELAGKNGFGKKMFIGNDAVRDDSLLITLAQRTKNKYANAVFEMINNMAMFILTDVNGLRNPAMKIIQKDPGLLRQAMVMLKKADFTIEDFSYNITKITSDMLLGTPFSEAIKDELIKNGKNISITTMHAVRDENGDRVGAIPFDMEQQESLGTNIFFNLIIMILDAINNGKMLYLDEFGSSLHTGICQYIIKFFQKNGIRTGSKLIINTHDVGLIKNGALGVLEKDDIMIVEKDRFEQTKITPLVDKMSRSDDNIGKKYSMGMYGGVPILEEIE